MQVRTFWVSNCCTKTNERIIEITLSSDCPSEIDFDLSQTSSCARDLEFDTAAKRREQGIITAKSTSNINDGVIHNLLQQDLQQSKFQRDRQVEGVKDRENRKIGSEDLLPIVGRTIAAATLGGIAYTPSPRSINHQNQQGAYAALGIENNRIGSNIGSKLSDVETSDIPIRAGTGRTTVRSDAAIDIRENTAASGFLQEYPFDESHKYQQLTSSSSLLPSEGAYGTGNTIKKGRGRDIELEMERTLLALNSMPDSTIKYNEAVENSGTSSSIRATNFSKSNPSNNTQLIQSQTQIQTQTQILMNNNTQRIKKSSNSVNSNDQSNDNELTDCVWGASRSTSMLSYVVSLSTVMFGQIKEYENDRDSVRENSLNIHRNGFSRSIDGIDRICGGYTVTDRCFVGKEVYKINNNIHNSNKKRNNNFNYHNYDNSNENDLKIDTKSSDKNLKSSNRNNNNASHLYLFGQNHINTDVGNFESNLGSSGISEGEGDKSATQPTGGPASRIIPVLVLGPGERKMITVLFRPVAREARTNCDVLTDIVSTATLSESDSVGKRGGEDGGERKEEGIEKEEGKFENKTDLGSLMSRKFNVSIAWTAVNAPQPLTVPVPVSDPITAVSTITPISALIGISEVSTSESLLPIFDPILLFSIPNAA